MTFFISNAWAESTTNVTTDHQILSGIANAGIVVQTLLLALIALSVWNWFIIFKKRGEFQQIATENESFLKVFWESSSLQQIQGKIGQYEHSPIARIFKAGYQEIERILNTHQQELLASGMENLERTIRKTHDDEIASMENHLSVLATTGSTAPFIGLLGTVIGIMNSFQDIASSGSASLAVVAPGISEALFATAVGLFAAIPAVVSYNYLLGKIKKVENQLNGFDSDFLNIARRNFFKGHG